MRMPRLKQILQGNGGSAMPLFLMVFFCTMCLIAAIWQNSILFLSARQVKTAMQKTALTAVTRNSEETYSSKREAYTGAWKKFGSWLDATESTDALTELAGLLGAERQGDVLVKKDAGGTVRYRLENIQLIVQNPSYLEEDELLCAKLTLDFVSDVRYAVTESNAISVPLTVIATNESKF